MIKIFFSIFMFSCLAITSVLASPEADRCAQVWNSANNQQNCLDTMPNTTEISMQVDDKVDIINPENNESESFGRQILIYAAAPVVAVGAVVSAIVVAPAWGIKKIFE